MYTNYTFVIFISRYAVPARTVTKSPGNSRPTIKKNHDRISFYL